MRETLTISLPRELRKELAKNAKAQHLSKSEIVSKAMLDKLWVDAMDESFRSLAPKPPHWPFTRMRTYSNPSQPTRTEIL